MILTVNLNASIDKAYSVDSFKPGTVTRVRQVMPTAGGKGLNVTRILTALEQEVIVTGFIGGFAGAFIEQELTRQKIPFEFTRVQGGETRSCINIIDKSSNTHTELLEPGPHISDKETEQFLTLYMKLVREVDVVTLSGSAPPGIDTDIYAKLIAIAKKADKEVILDSSGTYLVKGIQSAPTLVKPNRFEAEQLLGKQLEDTRDFIWAAQELLNMGPQTTAISLGAKGVLAASRLIKEVYWAAPPKIQPVNTVGCGDAMVAGFAIGLAEKRPLKECIRYAVAVSAAAALSPVTGNLVVDEVDNILKCLSFYHLNL